MRIGIDAHIVLAKHKRYDPKIARYTEKLVSHLLEADKKREHTWVLFFDQRMEGSSKLKKFERENVEIKHFPFIQYRQYLPVVYSHMLISSFLTSARLDVFHSPEGLIPYLYPGKIITTFHYVPKGQSESNLFVRTFMFGAKMAFARLCKRAKRIIVNRPADKRLLLDKHQCKAKQVVLMEVDDIERVDWSARIAELMDVYADVMKKKKAKLKKKRAVKKKKPRAAKGGTRARRFGLRRGRKEKAQKSKGSKKKSVKRASKRK